MDRFRRAALALLGTALITEIACTEEVAPPQEQQHLELFSWWVSGSETIALEALLAVHAEEHPDVVIVNAAHTTVDSAAAELQARMTQGDPPDTFQVHIGQELLPWVTFDGADASASVLEPLDHLADEGGWRAAIPAPVLDRAMFQDQLYAVPVNVHRTNCLFYNVRVFADAGLAPPRDLDEFFAVAETLEARGVTPLSMGTSAPWTLGVMMWDSVLLSLIGPELHTSYLNGEGAPDSPALADALRQAAPIFDYTNADAADLTWDQAVHRVADGAAAMTFMGDWAKGEFTSRGLVPDTDFGVVNWPSSSFVFVSDAFVLPKGAANRDGAAALLATMGSIAGQDAFNRLKGSIPSRTDTDRAGYDAISQRAMADFADPAATLLATPSMFVDYSFFAAADAAFAQFAADRNPDNVMIVFANHYDALQ
jgi:glucose/mannose transport system substrate-binding protein